MNTTGVKYIGSKRTLIPYILDAVKDIEDKRMIDAFTGTTRVAQAFRKSGWEVSTTDLSWASEAYAHLFLYTTAEDISVLERYIPILNGLEGATDWITNTYCDVRTSTGGIVRMWQPKNGQKADAIRNHIHMLETTHQITHHISMCLVAILILALDAVDNSVGVQQAYLKEWATRTHNPLQLKLPTHIPEGPVGTHSVHNCLTMDWKPATLAYIDPPYSAHSYATYYHIWDSIVRWDKPEVGLTTNRRIDRVAGTFDTEMKSTWNTKRDVLTSFETLFDRLPVKTILLSYNDESLVSLKELTPLLEKYTSYTLQEIDYTRNIMHKIGNATTHDTHRESKNVEYLIRIEK